MERLLYSHYPLFFLLLLTLSSCYDDFEEQKDPIIDNWKLERIEISYQQEKLESAYQTMVSPLDSNLMRFETGGFYEGRLNPDLDYLYFTRLGTTFRGESRVVRGTWNYFGEASNKVDYLEGELIFDRGEGFFLNQREIFLDYRFQNDSLILFSEAGNYLSSTVLRLLGNQETNHLPEDNYEYGFLLGQKVGFSIGAIAAADSLEDINFRATDHFENFQEYWEVFDRYDRFNDLENLYADYPLFLEGYNDGQNGQYRIGYDFVVGLEPEVSPREAIYYYFSRQ